MNNSLGLILFVSALTYKKPTLKKFLIIVSMLSLSACTSFQGKSEKLSSGIQKAYKVPATTANRIAPIILKNAEKHDIPPHIIAAVIRQESHYKPNARSPSGAVGLMQVIPKYWSKKCPGDLYNEEINIHCGSAILSEYHEKGGNWNKALGYYNVGPYGYENNRQSKKAGKKYAKSVKQHEKNLKKEM